MRELMVTHDLVLISFVQSLLKDAGIMTAVADVYNDWITGPVPRRLLVAEERWDQAARIMNDADLKQWISSRGA